MPVNFNSKPVILTVHGVQTGSNGEQNQNKIISKSINTLISELDGGPSNFPTFDSDIFRYEDINDSSTKFFAKVLASLTGNQVTGWLVEKTTDLIGDVLLALSQDKTYNEIKSSLREKLDTYSIAGRPVYVVAHSLGSFYAFEVINELMKNAEFESDNIADWPIHGLVTIGCPLGLDLFKRNNSNLESRKKSNVDITANIIRFPWRNYWDSQDPIVTGSLLGYPEESKFSERFDRQQAKKKGWDIRDNKVNSSTSLHLLAHIAYWENSFVAQGIVNLVLSNWARSNNRGK